jgi:hydrogenase nickel incorporation protein HypA/HybF
MHELAVCQALMEQVEQIATKQRAVSVVRIVLQIGPLSGVEADLLQQAFPFASAGTVAEGCELDILAQPIQVRCDLCGMISDATANNLVCGECGDWHTTLISGDEMLLQTVELEK